MEIINNMPAEKLKVYFILETQGRPVTMPREFDKMKDLQGLWDEIDLSEVIPPRYVGDIQIKAGNRAWLDNRHPGVFSDENYANQPEDKTLIPLEI